jgi:hypothetical protein
MNIVRYTILISLALLIVSSGIYNFIMTAREVIFGIKVEWNLFYFIGCLGSFAILIAMTWFMIWLLACCTNWLFSGHFKYSVHGDEATFIWNKKKKL